MSMRRQARQLGPGGYSIVGWRLRMVSVKLLTLGSSGDPAARLNVGAAKNVSFLCFRLLTFGININYICPGNQLNRARVKRDKSVFGTN